MKKNIPFKFLLGLAAVWVLHGCLENQAQDVNQKPAAQVPVIQNLSPEKVYHMINENPGLIIVDVRTDGEFTGELGHIQGAQLKPVQEIDTWASELDSLKDKEIVFVCRSGGRSARAATFFQQRGFTKIINMAGGMNAWNEQKYPVQGNQVKSNQ